MKKLSLLLTLLALLCLLTPAMVQGETFNSGDFKCTLLEDGSAEIKKYSGKASVLEIPAQLDGCAVTSIAKQAFTYCHSLTQVIIPEGVTSIGAEAFYNCNSLTQISLPDSVTSIEDGAFYSCDALSEVAIPVSVTSIGADAFGDCPLLTLTVFPGSFAETFAQENGIPCKYAN